jgi:hypothetical protein
MGQQILCVRKKVTWKFKISSWKTRIDQLMGSVEKAILIRHCHFNKFNKLTAFGEIVCSF